jgi:hypothetical protein
MLDFNKPYLLTDVGTLVAALICSEYGDRHDMQLSCYDNELRWGSATIQLREDRGICVAHFTGRFNNENSGLTKEDIDGILRGYPPFYRGLISVKNGPKIPHPIQSTDDIPRAGWIIGAGLSNDPPFQFFIATTRWPSGQFRKAMNRTLDVLEQNIAEKFPLDDNVETVIKAVRYMVTEQTGSGVERYLPTKKVPGGEFHRLSGRDCWFAMQIFNNFKPLSDNDVVRLRPILGPVLNAAFQGVYTVMQYMKNNYSEIVLPSLLENRFKAIYLEDCISS